MGQLERYGLYVLVLVIFLILGFAVWGDPAQGSAGGNKVVTAEGLKLPEAPPMGRNRPQPKTGGGSAMDEIKAQLKHGGNQPPIDNPSIDPAPTPPQPAAPDYVEHKVVKGDTLGSLAIKYLGKAHLFPVIEKANPGIDANKLPIGKTIRIPKNAAKSNATPVERAGSPFERPVPYGGKDYLGVAYRVEPRENMWTISRKLFSTDKYYHIIEGINPGVDPKALKPGQHIRVPTRAELAELNR